MQPLSFNAFRPALNQRKPSTTAFGAVQSFNKDDTLPIVRGRFTYDKLISNSYKKQTVDYVAYLPPSGNYLAFKTSKDETHVFHVGVQVGDKQPMYGASTRYKQPQSQQEILPFSVHDDLKTIKDRFVTEFPETDGTLPRLTEAQEKALKLNA